MRRMLLICSTVLYMVFPLARPSIAGVTILGGQQRVYGYVSDDYLNPVTNDPVFIEHSYDSGVVPWDGSILAGSAQIHPQVIGSPHVYSRSRTGALYAYVRTFAWGYGSAWATATVESTWTFRPDGDTLILEIDWWEMWGLEPASVDVTDLTTGVQLFNYTGPCGYIPINEDTDFPGLPMVRPLSVDPTHDYRMSMYLHSSANDDGWWEGWVRVNSPVPAPGAIALGAIGVGLIGWLRRNRGL